MNKTQYKQLYRELRIKLKNNPEYVPKTTVEYDLYTIWCNCHPVTINQLFKNTYGKAVFLMGQSMTKELVSRLELKAK